jgi:hypothetical protein
MGTTTWTESCPRCGNGNFTVGRDRESGEFGFCLECGYGYGQQENQMTLDEVNENRKETELDPLAELAPALPTFAWRDEPGTKCRRIRLNFHVLPESLYEALLDEFRRQCADYDSSGVSWTWDIVASDEDHRDGSVIFHMCDTPPDDDIPD